MIQTLRWTVHRTSRARRACVALLTLVAMLHLSLAGGDAACASHEGMKAATAMAGGAHASHSAHAAAAVADDAHAAAQPASDCPAPVQLHCCDAASGCGVATTLGEVVRGVEQRLPAGETPSLPSAVLVSVLTAPDPPPPKA